MTSKELFIFLTANGPLQKANAVILLEGDGFARIPKASSLIMQGWADILVFSGGIDNAAYGSFPLDKCLPRIVDMGVKKEQVIHEYISQHTRQQAEEIIDLSIKNGWETLLLVATQYHQYRAFLTFLKVLQEKGLDRSIHIINAAAEVNWFDENPWGKRIDLIKSEFGKIELYKQSGHISTYEDAIGYYRYWEEKKP